MSTQIRKKCTHATFTLNDSINHAEAAANANAITRTAPMCNYYFTDAAVRHVNKIHFPIQVFALSGPGSIHLWRTGGDVRRRKVITRCKSRAVLPESGTGRVSRAVEACHAHLHDGVRRCLMIPPIVMPTHRCTTIDNDDEDDVHRSPSCKLQ